MDIKLIPPYGEIYFWVMSSTLSVKSHANFKGALRRNVEACCGNLFCQGLFVTELSFAEFGLW